MARIPRVEILPDGEGIFHITNRGNNKRRIFLDDADHEYFIWLVVEAKRRFDIEVLNWVILYNHYHLLLHILVSLELSRAMHFIDFEYAKHFNARYKRSGHAWQGRFDAQLVESDEYLLTCAVYDDINPVRAGLVEAPEDWIWSSAGHHLIGRADPLTTPGANPVIVSLGKTDKERRQEYRKIAVGEMLRPVIGR